MQKNLMTKIEFFQKLNYFPLPTQKKFHNLTNKFRAYIGGLGSGKTHCGVFESLYNICAYPKTTGVILAPTNKLLDDSTLKAFKQFCPKSFITRFHESKKRMQFFNGTDVLFRSGEDNKTIDRLRNMEIGWYWMDELSLFSYYAWRVLLGRLRQKEAPLIGWGTTTPRGFNWAFKKFAKEPTKDYAWVNSSSRVNIHLPKGYVESLEREYAGAFAEQEIEGKFMAFEGVVYKEFNRNIHILDAVYIKGEGENRGIKILKTQERIMFKEIIISIDFGFTNPLAIGVFGVDNDKRMYLIEEFYEKEISTDQLKDILRGLKDKYKYKRAIADPSEATLIDDLNRNMLNVEKAINDVMPGIAEISARLKVQKDKKPRLYVLNKCSNAIMEFENYRYKDKKEDKEEKENPLKVMDHMMDAIRYAAMGLKHEATGHLDFI